MHCFFHTVQYTTEYRDPMQYESGKGERGLKEWAKEVAKTAQKTGLNVFIFQTITQVADRLFLMWAVDVVQHQQKKKHEYSDSRGTCSSQE